MRKESTDINSRTGVGYDFIERTSSRHSRSNGQDSEKRVRKWTCRSKHGDGSDLYDDRGPSGVLRRESLLEGRGTVMEEVTEEDKTDGNSKVGFGSMEGM